jgi:patatin-like phospholipase/acyl hydrolase
MSHLIKVLSIDGGGIRGIIPAMILAHIEEITGKPIAELFNLVAGTSTGGILALGLTKPDTKGQKPKYAAHELVKLYEEEGTKIFPKSFLSKFGNLREEKYSATGIETVLTKYFGETQLSDVLPNVDVLIPSYEIEQRRPYFFKSSKARTKLGRNKYNFRMKDVARATSAAPTYFEPTKIQSEYGLNNLALIDGGVFANNPAMCAYVEARSTNSESDILVVSLGTGELSKRLPYEKVRDWGPIEWARPILDVTFDGTSDTTHFQLQQLLSASERYFRFQTSMSDRGDAMDDPSKGNLDYLKDLAENIIHEKGDELERLCELLMEPDSSPMLRGSLVDSSLALR